MHEALHFIHVAAASIWVGGHLVLAIGLLPEALSKRDPEIILGFERVYERIGLPAMAVQIATGLWLAWRLQPDLATWVDWDDPDARTICLKFACLAATIGLAAHARLFIIPRLDAAWLPLRGIALGRRSWLFAGSDRGGGRAAAMYTLIGTAKLNDVDPQAWLADVLGRIAATPQSRLDELLPSNWEDSQRHDQAA